jgi:micrococcal nuclease
MVDLWIFLSMLSFSIPQVGSAPLQQTGPVAPAGAQDAPLVAEEIYTAQVVSVEDGDTIVVKSAAEQTTVHVAGVDAPELSQPAGPAAREFVRKLVGGGTVRVRLINVLERLARIEVNGSDVALALVGAGMAWHCPRYTEDRALIAAESEARREKRGLWRAARPTPPWLHRGAGMCWEQEKAHGPQDFSGVWTAVSPSDRAGAQLVIRQDTSTLTLVRPGHAGGRSVTYTLEGTVSRMQRNDEGRLVDALARTWWTGRALVIEERSWPVHGQESVQWRQVLWIDDRGLLNVEESSPQPLGRSDARTIVFRRDDR